MSAKNKALLNSFLRVLVGCLVTAYTAVVGFDPPWTVDGEEALKIGNALWGATALTAFNYFRKGETRFGTHAKDSGMGGDDALEAGGKVQVPPDGERVDPEVALDAAVVDDGETPVQTDNGPRVDEGERLSSRQGVIFSGDMR